VVPLPVRWIGVALLFALCFCVVSRLFDAYVWGPGISFALCSALLFLRSWRAVFAAPLMVALYIGSIWVFLSTPKSLDIHYYISGLVGGVGLVLCAAICYPRLLSPRYLCCGGALGAICALPFEWWSDSTSTAIWQAVVGTYLYAICSRVNRKVMHDGFQEGGGKGR
jgi:hypothetical protein